MSVIHEKSKGKKQDHSQDGKGKVLGKDLEVPAVQRRAALDPELRGARAAAVHTLGAAIKVFAGQRSEGFFVDLGAIFDLGNIRPIERRT